MTSRTTVKTYTFTRPFTLRSMTGETFPAGAYTVETDEDLIESLSFAAYRRTATWMRMPPRPREGASAQIVPIDPSELETLDPRLGPPSDYVLNASPHPY